jgi:hypothetical protein
VAEFVGEVRRVLDLALELSTDEAKVEDGEVKGRRLVH